MMLGMVIGLVMFGLVFLGLFGVFEGVVVGSLMSLSEKCMFVVG